jgi:hypothetical protein
LLIQFLLAQFWHNDVRIVRGQNKTIHNRDVNNLVNMWKTMTGTNPSVLPIGDTDEDAKPDIKTNEQQIPLKQRNKSEMILARKFRNLQEYANAYNLNLSNSDDTLLRTNDARENVQRMANDILASIDETSQMNIGSLVAQIGGNNQRSLTRSRMETLYQELMDVMPPKWKEVFQKRQEQSN